MRSFVPAVAVASLALGASTAQAAFPGANGRIAFLETSTRDDPGPEIRRSIATVLPSGSGHGVLRDCRVVAPGGECAIGSPAWSPRGTRVAFDAGSGLALIRGDGSGFRELGARTADDGEPAWSPDGRRLVFSGARTPAGRRDLYVLDLRTGRVRRLTFRGGRSPAWSSRGRIAFVRGSRPPAPGYRPGAGDVYTVLPSGRGLRRITYHRGGDPEWSPYGRWLAFVRQRRYGPFRLYLVRPDGSGLRRVRTPGADSPEQPAWGPDGSWIAYHSFESGIWIQRLDGSRVRQVSAGAVSADTAFDALQPDWQPLSRR